MLLCYDDALALMQLILVEDKKQDEYVKKFLTQIVNSQQFRQHVEMHASSEMAQVRDSHFLMCLL